MSDDLKKQIVDKIFRVAKSRGRAAISDIISGEAMPQSLKDDKELWSGCISEASQEQEILTVFLRNRFSKYQLR